jgi:hypothetical protein
MQDIIAPIDRNLLLSELNEHTFLRKTNKAGNHLYIVDIHNAPHTLREIGRLREVAFRDGGGGTGLDCDLDDHDTGEHCYKQLIVWDPEGQEIVGGYRYILCRDAMLPDGRLHLSTTELFNFSDTFRTRYLPKTIELGRSFVQPKYQPLHNRKGMFSMDNLWDGLGALTVEHDDMEYFFGKVTMYTHFNHEARDLILTFMYHYFNDPEKLVTALPGLKCNLHAPRPDFLEKIKDMPYKDGYTILNKRVRELGENIPPLVNTYMNTSPTMRVFDTAVNHHFGDVEETAILININDIYPTKKKRHVISYSKNPMGKIFTRKYWTNLFKKDH